jgi:hypothetical protein
MIKIIHYKLRLKGGIKKKIIKGPRKKNQESKE